MSTAQALALRVGTRLTKLTPSGPITGLLIERSRTSFLVQWSDDTLACYSYRMVWALEVMA